MTVTVALAQLNCTVGDFAGNAARIVAAAREAHQAGARILVTPELSLTGYPPEDLLLRPAFIDASARALDALIAELAAFAGLHVLIGHPQISLEPPAPGVLPKPTNACTVAADGRVVGRYHKLDLPNNEVFDEKRYFQPGTEPFVFEVDGTRFGVIICEDAWYPTATAYAKAADAQVVLIPNASPYHLDKEDLREQIIGARVKESGLPHVYANLVGGQDELVFDGGSFVLDAEGKVVVQMGQFVEGLGYAQFDGGKALPGTIVPEAPLEAQVYEALKLGVRDYLGKNGFPGAIIGLSGSRLRPRAGDCRRCAGRRPRARRHDAVALHGGHLVGRCARHGRPPRRAVRRNPHRADVRRVQGRAGGGISQPAGRRHGREHPGAHSRHAFDGAVQQVRPHRADHRQ